MKRLTILMLLLSSTNVLAEWIWVGESEEHNAYVDLQTIRKKGNKVKMWSLNDFKKIQVADNIPYISTIEINEFDCSEVTYASLEISAFAENMGKGKVVNLYNFKKNIQEIPPYSMIKGLFKVACGKRK